MTKKFIHTEDKKEFLIPDIFDNLDSFIGLKSNNKYNTGIVVYAGKDLTLQMVLDKVIDSKKLNFFQKRKAKKVLTQYLADIKEIKVGKKVSIKNYRLTPKL